MCKVVIKKSTKPEKKMMATFTDCQTGRDKTIHFGAKNMSDYTKHKDKERKKRYLQRHKASENWNNPKSAGALSRWILWNKPSLRESIASYKKKFRLK
jgi:hypothetical protein